ncbi:GntP family permease [Thermovenabulum gondwanense]|uniref:High-affinity gluconate transporter n=1 Tax=Thermovenabulum gondwanense TaxID=520767 RepID=A0A162MPY4_9FIRM|nr:gluconate:H+ symporter [Thermovenabulum gondwanense]KYO66911.1 High-affinity gluconate transporter [Thermovenabulum gondwanense]
MLTGSALLIVFLVAIIFVLVSIIKFKINPFLSLLLASLLTAFLVRMPTSKIPSTITSGFGNTLQGIGIVIGLGVILGQILSEAGATEQIANTLLRFVGEKNSPLAVNLTGYLVSIPVFFDAAFVILMSLIKQISRKTERSLITYVTALAVGLIVTHATVIPTPGPVAVANNMNVNLGIFTLYAIIVSIPAALIGGWLYGVYLGKKYDFDEKEVMEAISEIGKEKSTNSDKKPSGALSIFVLLLPIILILFGTVMSIVLPKESIANVVFGFLGEKNIALLIGVIVAIITLKPYLKDSLENIIAKAAGSAGMILLITGAGGSFGNMINSSGIGKYLVDILSHMNISIIVLAFILSQVLRAAQGSTTVALVTTSSILGPIVAQLGASPVLVALAICCGGIGLSLPNDSGFWVVNRFSNFDINKTIQSWTIGGTIAGVVGFIMVLILSLFSGVLPGLL